MVVSDSRFTNNEKFGILYNVFILEGLFNEVSYFNDIC